MASETDFLLNSVHVAAFRGLKEVELEQLARVNLLVGGNNSGKTSVLEALAVFSSPLDIAEWSTIARTREVRHIPATFGGGLSNVEAIRWLFPVRSDSGFYRRPERPGTANRNLCASYGVRSGTLETVLLECTTSRLVGYRDAALRFVANVADNLSDPLDLPNLVRGAGGNKAAANIIGNLLYPGCSLGTAIEKGNWFHDVDDRGTSLGSTRRFLEDVLD